MKAAPNGSSRDLARPLLWGQHEHTGGERTQQQPEIALADYRQAMGMLYGGQIYHVPFGDADALERQLDICANVGIGVAFHVRAQQRIGAISV